MTDDRDVADGREPVDGSGRADECDTTEADEVGLNEDHEAALDAAFDLLATRPRRAVLYRLADDGVVSFEDLTTTLVEASDDGDRRRAATTLRHVHLPRLLDSGVVAVDDRTGTVQYRPSGALVSSMRWARAHEGSVSGTERGATEGGTPPAAEDD